MARVLWIRRWSRDVLRRPPAAVSKADERLSLSLSKGERIEAG
jgi:hypothetical protein